MPRSCTGPRSACPRRTPQLQARLTELGLSFVATGGRARLPHHQPRRVRTSATCHLGNVQTHQTGSSRTLRTSAIAGTAQPQPEHQPVTNQHDPERNPHGRLHHPPSLEPTPTRMALTATSRRQLRRQRRLKRPAGDVNQLAEWRSRIAVGRVIPSPSSRVLLRSRGHDRVLRAGSASPHRRMSARAGP